MTSLNDIIPEEPDEPVKKIVYRDSVTGEFVTEEYAKAHPDTTESHAERAE